MVSSDMTGSDGPIVRLRGIGKVYGGVTALRDVDFELARHSIHAVLGENGAGKSTLIKIISGVVQPDGGTIEVDGRPHRFSGPRDAAARGIVGVFQELSLVPDLMVADNILLADPPGWAGFINRRAQRRRAEQLLAQVGCEDVDPRLPVRELTLSRRQLIELAKAIGRDPRVLILDEATSALGASDVATVHRILERQRADGLAILLISHRMHEIEALADTCSVFRNGRHIETFPQQGKRRQQVLELMIGRDISQVYPPKPARDATGPPALAIRDLAWTDRLHGVSLEVGRGEIVALGGLEGQGQRELLLALFGVLRDVHGTVEVDGRRVRIHSPAKAKAAGLDFALVPEDRKSEGLALGMSVRENLTLASLDRFTRAMVLDGAAERAAVAAAVRALNIQAPSIELAVGTLSGGNQQKVVLSKWLINRPRVILLMDPTRGIDVGTKQEFYAVIRRLAAEGVCFLFYSTDYEEIIGMCDRVLILYAGRIVAELSDGDITESNIVGAAFNMAPAP